MIENNKEFDHLLQKAAELRGHSCAGLTLGLKMAQLGLKLLNMNEVEKENLVVFVENDKCSVDAIQVATGCSAGSRRLKMMHYGKSAASFIDRTNRKGYRIVEKKDLSTRAMELAIKDNLITPDQKVEEFSKLEKKIMMNAFEKMAPEELFDYYPVTINLDTPFVYSKTEPRRICSQCKEEIRNGLGVERGGKIFCKACNDGAYYQTL